MSDTTEEQQQEATPTESPRVFTLRFSGPGILVAAVFFALSLTPSLLPRGGAVRGSVPCRGLGDRSARYRTKPRSAGPTKIQKSPAA